jgi:hypothetical protein
MQVLRAQGFMAGNVEAGGLAALAHVTALYNITALSEM